MKGAGRGRKSYADSQVNMLGVCVGGGGEGNGRSSKEAGVARVSEQGCEGL